MSLKAAAQHLAAHGRNGDTTLVHMTHDEVRGLQELAKQHGTTLTINPQTGMPEAWSLSKLVKAAAPIAAGYFLGPAGYGLTAAQAGLAVGGGMTLLTGSLEKGIQAGLGAYGGAGMGGAANAGVSEAAAAKEAAAAQNAAATANEIGAANAAAIAPETKLTLAESTKAALGEKGIGALTAGETARYGMAAAAPILMEQQGGGPSVPEQQGYIRPKYYDYRTQTFYDLPAVKAKDWGSRSFDEYRNSLVAKPEYASGGLTEGGMAGGGPMMGTDNAFDFQQRSEPVVRMADGGYTSYSTQQINDYISQNPGVNIAEAAQQFNADPAAVVSAQAGANATPDSITAMYQQILGRAPDTGGAEYWSKQFGDTLDTDEIATFRNAAQAELNARPAAPAAAPSYTDYELPAINAYINKNNLDSAGIAAAAQQFNADPERVAAAQHAQDVVSNVYRNVIGRDPDPHGLAYWTNQLMAGQVSDKELYNTFLTSAKENNELVKTGLSAEQAAGEYKGYASSDKTTIADEWVRNVLGREVTDADRQQQWYKDATSGKTMNTQEAARGIYGNFLNYATSVGATTTTDKATLARQIMREKGLTDADVYAQTGKTVEQLIGKPNTSLDIYHASQLLAPGSAFDFQSLKSKTQGIPAGGVGGGYTTDTYTGQPTTTPATYRPQGASNPYGNAINPGDITINPDGSRTVTPNIPGRPYGGFTGMGQVRDAYTAGGGNLGQTLAPTRSYTNTGGSADAYKYLFGEGAWPSVTRAASPAKNTVGNTTSKYIWKDNVLVLNPDYVDPVLEQAKKDAGPMGKAVLSTVPGDGGGDSASAAPADGNGNGDGDGGGDSGGVSVKRGGLMAAYAHGGPTHLGDYSDGGRLLRGPGDGVSDSIPATIGGKQPARLADGEFVVPARIVSELGNGSTEAGARKLYAMMDRVQKARGKTVGKGKVAKNTRADKYLPG